MNSTENLGLTLFESDDKFRISQETQSLNKNMKVLDEEIPKRAKTDIIAKKFNPENANGAGSYVVYKGELYILPVGHEAEVTWENTSKTKIMLADEVAKKYEKPVNGIPAADLATGVIPDVSGKANLSVIAPAFAEATVNVAGSLVTYTDGVIYLLPEGHEAGITWGNTVKTATNIAAELGGVKSALTPINRRFNNDTMLDNYALSALNKGRNVSPIVSFIDDDNNKQFSTFWLPIIEAKEIPVSIAVIVSQVGVGNSGTWDDIKNYHDNYGVEILSHSYYHKINAEDYDSLTVDEISENDFGLAKRILEEHGYEADLLVYSGSATDNKKVRIAVTRDYIGGIDGGDALNTTPISHYSIKRYHYAYDDGQTPDIDVLKGYVDACVAQNAWLIFESHSQYSSMTPETAAVVCDLIDYIRSVGAEIVSAKEGFARFANIVDVEDGETRIGKFKLSPDGIVFNDTGINGGYSSSQIHNFYSGISSYKDYAVTKERIITDALLFPHNDSGILETIRYADNMVQYFMPFHYQEMWVREVANNALPAEFTCLNETSGAYDNRNSLAGERKGNIYFDETNNRPIFCKTAGKRSVDQFTVTHGATSAGNIKISYAFGSKDIAVAAGDTSKDVADKIANASFIGHNIKQSIENPLVLYLTRLLTGSTDGASFTDTDSTGVTVSVSRVVTGTASAWVDASGNTL